MATRRTITRAQLDQLRHDSIPGYGTAAQLELHDVETAIAAGKMEVVMNPGFDSWVESFDWDATGLAGGPAARTRGGLK